MNYQFLILQSIAIILVVVGHIGGIYLLTDWFPAYSFHMPLFVFISGYFYKTDSDLKIVNFIKHKFKKLLLNFYIWNFIYGIIITILLNKGIVNFGNRITMFNLFISPWIDNQQFGLNTSAWFVPALFSIQVTYVLLRKFLKVIKFNNEYILSIILFITGLISIFYANKGFNKGLYLPIIRLCFLIPFYQLGYIYKIKLETKDKVNNFIYFSIIFIVQAVLIKKYGNLEFSTVFCGFNNENITLSYITSITGILLWLRISRILLNSFNESKIIKLIGSNTWTIMMHHQIIIFLMNYLIGKIGRNDFNYELFKNDSWYGYSAGDGRLLLIYAIGGVLIPISIKYIYNQFIIIINKINT